MAKLTEKQRKFVEAFMGPAKGNATEAARIAGYSGSDATLRNAGSRLLTNANISEAIKERQESDPLVADREERQRFWSEVMRNDQADMKDRLKASEILGKSQADFTERIDHTTGGESFETINVSIVSAKKP